MANKEAGKNGIATRFKAGSAEAIEASRKGYIARTENQQYFKALQQACRAKVTAENAQLLAEMLLREALDGNLKALELLRDTAGEKPVTRHAAEVNMEMETLTDDDRRLLSKVYARLSAEDTTE